MNAAAPLRSAGCVVLREFAGGWRVLVLRAYRNWDLPKGLPEPGEDPLATALRETREETSLSNLRFPWGTGWRETPPYGRGKVARFYLAEAPAGDVLLPVSEELGRPEHLEFRWVPLEEARGLLPGRFEPILRWATTALAEGRSSP